MKRTKPAKDIAMAFDAPPFTLSAIAVRLIAEIAALTEEQRRSAYFAFLRLEERECLNVVRKPAFLAFLDGSPLARAAQEAKLYS